MGIEASQVFEQQREKYGALRQALSDSHLSEEEQRNLEESFYSDCVEVQTEAQTACSELQREVQFYNEFLTLDASSITKLQTLSGLSDGNIDGVRGPTTFAGFLQIGERVTQLEGLSPRQVVEQYNIIFEQLQTLFDSYSIEERRDIQGKVGAGSDGYFGPITFRRILQNRNNDVFITETFFSGAGERVQEAVDAVSIGDERVVDQAQLQDQEIVVSETEPEITQENISSTIESAFSQNNPDLIFRALQSDVLRGNTERSQNYIRELQAYIIEHNAYEQARSIFCSPETSVEDTGTIYTVDFRGDRMLTQLITAIDIFGDVSYLKRPDGTFIRRYEPGGEYRSLDGRRLSIVSGTSVMVPNEQEIIRIRAYIDTIDRRGVPAVEDSALGRQEVFRTSQIRNGSPVEITTYTRENILGQEALTRMVEQGTLSSEGLETIRNIMLNGQDRFYPVLIDESIIFMTNPTYAPDRDNQGVSSVEAREYAERRGYLLPSSLQTNAARNQAQLRGILPSNYNEHVSDETQRNNTARQRAMLEEIISANGDAFVGGFTKIWAFDTNRNNPGLNGWYSNVRTGETIQGYSTWHAGDPDYDDYSQAAQFVSPVWVDAEGNIQGTAEHIIPVEEHATTRDEIIASPGFQETFSGIPAVVDVLELQEQAPIEYNNGLQMSDEEFAAAKIDARENGMNPSFSEFQTEVRTLSRNEKIQFQEVVRAEVDGAPGIGSYTHYLHSKIREAGFSVTEAARFKRINSVGGQEEIAQIESTYEVTLTELPTIQEGDLIHYDPDYGELIIVNAETGARSTIDVADGIFDSIENAFTQNNRDIIFQTLSQIRRNGAKSQRYVSEIQSYISENNVYEQARNIFCRTETQETETGIIYTLDFRGDPLLTQMLKSVDIFGDMQYLRNRESTYIRRYESGGEFNTLEGGRLSIVSGTSILVPNEAETQRIQEYMDLLERQAEIRESMENNLSEVISRNGKETIEAYFTIASEREQRDMLRNIESTVYQERLFSNMRNMFAHQEGEGYIFDMGDSEVLKNLSAFTLFGDYKTLLVNGVEYESLRAQTYRSETGDVLNIVSGESIISPREESLRTEEDYERLNEYPELAREFGEWVTRQRLSGVRNDCGGAVGNLLVNFGLTQFRREPGNRFSQLSQQLGSTSRNGYAYEHVLDQMVEEGFFSVEEVATPADARAGGIIVFRRGAPRSSGASAARQAAGHVEIKGSNQEYYSYYHSSTPGGSARSNSTDPEVYQRQTGFVGKVYYPIMRS